MGILIGYIGETLDSLQYLISLAVNKGHETEYKRVILDTENYRVKREETLKKLTKHKFEVVITSYEGVNICISTLKKIKWECLIIDEAHRIKNENALLSRNVRSIESKFRFLF